MTDKPLVVFLLVTAIACRSLAAIFAKLAAINSVGGGIAGLVINPWLAAELGALAIQAVTWTLVLRHRPLSKVYPYNSLVFGALLAASLWLFHETFEWKHFLGFAVMMVGIYLMATERRKMQPERA